jgi:hypothetical protein
VGRPIQPGCMMQCMPTGDGFYDRSGKLELSSAAAAGEFNQCKQSGRIIAGTCKQTSRCIKTLCAASAVLRRVRLPASIRSNMLGSS